MPFLDRVTEMEDADGAKTELLTGLEPLLIRSEPRVFGPDCLVALYDRAGKKTSKGILLPESYIEDKVQGKIGLLIQMGPLCYGPEFVEWFGDKPLRIHDWVLTSIRDGVPFLLGTYQMRSVEWKYLRVATRVPDLIM